MHKPIVIDLFCGAGGFSLGAHLAGFASALAIDVDSDLTDSFNDNFLDTKLVLADIGSIDIRHVLRQENIDPGSVAGVIGGPPCQGFSVIGRRDPTDPRNHLVSHFFRVVKELQPSFFLMENVPGILRSPFRMILDEALDSVARNYRILGPIHANAGEYGAATSRPRVLVLGCRRDRADRLTEAELTKIQTTQKVTVYEAIHDLPHASKAFQVNDGQFCAKYVRKPDRSKKGGYARAARSAPPRGLGSKQIRLLKKNEHVSGFQPTRHTTEVLKRFSNVKPGNADPISKCPRLTWDSQCSTLRAGTGKDKGSFQSIRPIHPTENRVITVREAARIQGFPDWFQFHPTKWHSFRMIGNSVSPYLARALLERLFQRVS